MFVVWSYEPMSGIKAYKPCNQVNSHVFPIQREGKSSIPNEIIPSKRQEAGPGDPCLLRIKSSNRDPPIGSRWVVSNIGGRRRDQERFVTRRRYLVGSRCIGAEEAQKELAVGEPSQTSFLHSSPKSCPKRGSARRWRRQRPPKGEAGGRERHRSSRRRFSPSDLQP
jgi:hypothetical protein